MREQHRGTYAILWIWLKFFWNICHSKQRYMRSVHEKEQRQIRRLPGRPERIGEGTEEETKSRPRSVQRPYGAGVRRRKGISARSRWGRNHVYGRLQGCRRERRCERAKRYIMWQDMRPSRSRWTGEQRQQLERRRINPDDSDAPPGSISLTEVSI